MHHGVQISCCKGKDVITNGNFYECLKTFCVLNESSENMFVWRLCTVLTAIKILLGVMPCMGTFNAVFILRGLQQMYCAKGKIAVYVVLICIKVLIDCHVR